MKNIKTYEGFKKLFLKNKSNLLKNKEQIESFLDDIKDISIKSDLLCFMKNNFLYCFFIKEYDSKKDEIDLYLE